MGQRTPLYDQHLALGAKMVDFGGWDMPLHYGSQVEEHHQVRRDCGVFDVSHMTVVDVAGDQASAYLQHLLANDVARLKSPGRALYSAMLNERGGVIDDLIVYLTDWGYRLVVNASTRDKDLAWMQSRAADFAVEINERPQLAMLAIQGPHARTRTAELVSQARATLIQELKPFQGLAEGDWFIGRTGYTGEDGLEIILPAEQAPDFLSELVGAGIPPIGLGARDTLRLEAGLNLYGQDMTEEVSPLAANMGWTVAWEPDERDFVGRVGEAFAAQRWGVTPDILTCAKGLTNGAIPMGAVLVADHLFDAFMKGPESVIEFFHGYTYSGHPVACAAALATQQIYQQENLFQKAIDLEPYWQEALFSLRDLPNVIDIRTVGLVAGIQFAAHADGVGKRGYEVFRECFEKGLLVRASGDTIALSPALIVEKAEIDQMMELLSDGIRQAG